MKHKHYIAAPAFLSAFGRQSAFLIKGEALVFTPDFYDGFTNLSRMHITHCGNDWFIPVVPPDGIRATNEYMGTFRNLIDYLNHLGICSGCASKMIFAMQQYYLSLNN